MFVCCNNLFLFCLFSGLVSGSKFRLFHILMSDWCYFVVFRNTSCVKIASTRKWYTLWYSQGYTVPVDTNCRSKGYLWLSQLYDTHWRSAYTWHSQLTCIADEHTCMLDCPSWHTLQINIQVCETVPVVTHCRSTYMYVRLSQVTHIADQHTCMWDCPSWHALQINMFVRLSQLMHIIGQHTCIWDCPSWCIF